MAEDFDRYPVLFMGLEHVLCPRVHFKTLVFDSYVAYIGSAELTGEDIGMKSTPNSKLRRKKYCSDPVVQ